jgi:hypothetical protein
MFVLDCKMKPSNYNMNNIESLDSHTHKGIYTRKKSLLIYVEPKGTKEIMGIKKQPIIIHYQSKQNTKVEETKKEQQQQKDNEEPEHKDNEELEQHKEQEQNKDEEQNKEQNKDEKQEQNKDEKQEQNKRKKPLPKPVRFTFEIPKGYNFNNSYKGLLQNNNNENINNIKPYPNHQINRLSLEERRVPLLSYDDEYLNKRKSKSASSRLESSKSAPSSPENILHSCVMNKTRGTISVPSSPQEKKKTLYMRRSSTTFNDYDWKKFNIAWDNISKKGTLMKFINIHDLTCKKKPLNKKDNFVLGTSLFLPWYRWFIASLEDELHQEGSELPFWNPLEVKEIPKQLKKPNDVMRSFNVKLLPKMSNLNKILQNESFDNSEDDSYFLTCLSKTTKNGFTFELEKYYNNICNAVGGNLLQTTISPMDPLFWMLHAYIDLLWVLWSISQRCKHNININKNYDTFQEIIKNTSCNYKEHLKPLSINILLNISQVETITGIGYNYIVNNHESLTNI